MGDYIPYQKIVSNLDRIQKGDTLYVVSDILELAKAARENGEKFDRDLFLTTLQEKVGEEGTLMIPTFNWDFCKGIPFDYYKTPCKTGALGVAALKRKDFVRTKHPMYSFAVWGKDQEYLFRQDEPNCFGENSLFDYMYKKDAKALVIGLDAMDGLTFMHHVEEMVSVPFRFQKTFEADYTDENGVTTRKQYTMYVRDLEMDAKEHTKGFSELLETLNVSETKMANGVPFRVMRLRDIYALEEMDIRYNECRNLYVYPGQPEKQVEM